MGITIRNKMVQTLDGEEWKPLPEHEGYYEISNFGRVKSIPCYRESKKYKSGGGFIDKEVLIAQFLRLGYYGFNAYVDGKKKNIKTHRYIALAFIANPENKQFINHINGVKTDNRIENLEWCTHKENMSHSTYILGNNIGEKSVKSTITTDTAIKIRDAFLSRKESGLKPIEIAKTFGVSRTNVYKIGTGQKWSNAISNVQKVL